MFFLFILLELINLLKVNEMKVYITRPLFQRVNQSVIYYVFILKHMSSKKLLNIDINLDI